MYSETDIIAKSWLVREVVNLVLLADELSVDKIFVIGSYASGKQNEYSDLDFLVQLKGGKKIGMLFPKWKQIREVHSKVGDRIHVVFGTEEAAEELYQKHKSEKKDYSYKQIKFQAEETTCGKQ